MLSASHVTVKDDPWRTAGEMHQVEGRWQVTVSSSVRVNFTSAANEHLQDLLSAWPDDDLGGLLSQVGEDQITSEILNQASKVASDAELYGFPMPDWDTVYEQISRSLSRSVAAVPIGGVYSDSVDSQGYTAPITIGRRCLVGHLDVSLEEALASFAQSVGLPGFRFTGESWWTEFFISAQEGDVDDELDEQGRPWLVMAWALPTSGLAAEHTAVVASEALLGGLVLLDRNPNGDWGRFTPWIPGCLSLAGDPYDSNVMEGAGNTIDTRVQQVDGRLLRLVGATTSGAEIVPREIEIDRHAGGPGREVLASIADAASVGFSGRSEFAEKLTRACRLALYAVAATSSDVRATLAGKAIEILCEDSGGSAKEYAALVKSGQDWRNQHESSWPRYRTMQEPLNPDLWRDSIPSFDTLIAAQKDIGRLPPWTPSQFQKSGVTLTALQAAFFGYAARMESGQEP